MQPSLESNLTTVRRRIEAAAAGAGRRPEEIELVAVTKSVAPEMAAALARLGATELGESRADELERKSEFLTRAGIAARWHFVGHVQKNKARRIVQCADAIHSVDSLDLLATIDRLAGELGRRTDLYLQVKLHPEPEKTGLDPAELPDAIAASRELHHASLRGLMAMAPLVEGSEAVRLQAARGVFEALRALAEDSDREVFRDGRIHLSMGMSDDFEVAIAAGSDCVRIGTSLFAGLAAPRSERRSIEPSRAESDVVPAVRRAPEVGA